MPLQKTGNNHTIRLTGEIVCSVKYVADEEEGIDKVLQSSSQARSRRAVTTLVGKRLDGYMMDTYIDERMDT